jgi:hypothetical protein
MTRENMELSKAEKRGLLWERWSAHETKQNHLMLLCKSMIQNDMIIRKDELIEWLKQIKNLKTELKMEFIGLISDTIEILKEGT